MNKYIFIVVTSDFCKNCTIFKAAYLPNLRAQIIREGKVHITEIDLPTGGKDSLNPKYPSDLKRFIISLPCFILVTEDSWDQGGPLEGHVFGGVKKEHEYLKLPIHRPTSIPNLIGWIEEVVASGATGQVAASGATGQPSAAGASSQLSASVASGQVPAGGASSQPSAGGSLSPTATGVAVGDPPKESVGSIKNPTDSTTNPSPSPSPSLPGGKIEEVGPKKVPTYTSVNYQSRRMKRR